MKAFAPSSKRKQRGVAALFVSVVLLVAVTLMVMFASRVALLDQRTSANEYRHSQAFVIAEAGLEQAAAFLRARPRLHDPGDPDGWVECEPGDPFPCDDDPTVSWVFGAIDSGVFTSSVDPLLDLVTSDPVMPQATSFLVRTDAGRVRGIGVGTSDDGTGAAVVQVDFGIATILSPGELPPLMAPESSLSGSFTIVPNPNLGGPGVAISAWTTNPTTGSGVGSWQTCDHGDFRDNSGNVCIDTKSGGELRDWGNCSCSDTRSTPTDIRSDIVTYHEDDFPESPFTYVFGDPETDTLEGLKPQVKAMAQTLGLVLPNCNSLASDFNQLVGSALVWIEGNCEPPSNTVIGTREKPIILVIEGNTKINANTELWGLVVGLGASMNLNGGPVIHGAIVSEVATDLTNGNYKQVYDEGVFTRLRDDSINTALTKIDYSWRDF